VAAAFKHTRQQQLTLTSAALMLLMLDFYNMDNINFNINKGQFIKLTTRKHNNKCPEKLTLQRGMNERLLVDEMARLRRILKQRGFGAQMEIVAVPASGARNEKLDVLIPGYDGLFYIRPLLPDRAQNLQSFKS
jgi:hypothetical protein